MTTIDFSAPNQIDAKKEAETRAVTAEPVCIAGMHRSGTSMVTSLLKECGLFLGAENELRGKALDNTRGFWENQNFVELNEDILTRYGGRWDQPPDFPVHWELDEDVSPLLQSARELVERFSGHGPWGWKDPRNSLTIPFWKMIIPSLRFVICVRNPLEVAHSLFVRGDAAGTSQFQLWLHYYQQILAATSESSRIITHYQSYFEDASLEVLRVASWLGFELSDEAAESARKHVSGRLRHHDATTEDLKTAGASEEIVDLYLRLCEEAGPVCSQFLERESRSGRPPRQRSDKNQALQLMRIENLLAKNEERLRLVELHNARLEVQINRLSAEAQLNGEARFLNNEAKLHEVRASLLPIIRMLDTLRAARNRLRSVLKG